MAIAILLVATADDCCLQLITAERKPSILYLFNSDRKNQTWLHEKVSLESVNAKAQNQKDTTYQYMQDEGGTLSFFYAF